MLVVTTEESAAAVAVAAFVAVDFEVQAVAVVAVVAAVAAVAAPSCYFASAASAADLGCKSFCSERHLKQEPCSSGCSANPPATGSPFA